MGGGSRTREKRGREGPLKAGGFERDSCPLTEPLFLKLLRGTEPAGVGVRVPAPPEPPGRGPVWRPAAKPLSWVGAWLRPDLRFCLLSTRVTGAFTGVVLRRPLFFLLSLFVLRQHAAGPTLLPALAERTGLQDAVDAEGRRWG